MLNKNAKQGMEVKENSRKSFISFLVYFRVSFTLASKLTVQVVYLLVHIEFSRSSEFGVWHSDLENNQYSPNQWINHAIFRYYFPFGSLKSVHNPFRRSKMFIFPHKKKRFRGKWTPGRRKSQFLCKCGKSFQSKGARNRHQKIKHSKEKVSANFGFYSHRSFALFVSQHRFMNNLYFQRLFYPMILRNTRNVYLYVICAGRNRIHGSNYTSIRDGNIHKNGLLRKRNLLQRMTLFRCHLMAGLMRYQILDRRLKKMKHMSLYCIR